MSDPVVLSYGFLNVVDPDPTGAAGLMINDNFKAIADTQVHTSGRLTPVSGEPVVVDDYATVTELYFTPYKGNQLTLWDGTRWTPVTFAETAITVPNTRWCLFDIFGYLDGGSLAIETLDWDTASDDISGITGIGVYSDNLTGVSFNSLGHTLAIGDLVLVEGAACCLAEGIWRVSAVDTGTVSLAGSYGTRATTLALAGLPSSALAGGRWYKLNTDRATALTYSDGRLTKSGDKTRLYLGTGCTTGTNGQTAYTAKQRLLTNALNPLRFGERVVSGARVYPLTSPALTYYRFEASYATSVSQQTLLAMSGGSHHAIWLTPRVQPVSLGVQHSYRRTSGTTLNVACRLSLNGIDVGDYNDWNQSGSLEQSHPITVAGVPSREGLNVLWSELAAVSPVEFYQSDLSYASLL
jgi:hypothetical protein